MGGKRSRVLEAVGEDGAREEGGGGKRRKRRGDSRYGRVLKDVCEIMTKTFASRTSLGYCKVVSHFFQVLHSEKEESLPVVTSGPEGGGPVGQQDRR